MTATVQSLITARAQRRTLSTITKEAFALLRL